MIHEIAKLLNEEYGIRDLDPDASIRKDLGLSSFELMDLVCLVEDKFGVRLEEDRYLSMTTVKELSDYLMELVQAKG